MYGFAVFVDFSAVFVWFSGYNVSKSLAFSYFSVFDCFQLRLCDFNRLKSYKEFWCPDKCKLIAGLVCFWPLTKFRAVAQKVRSCKFGSFVERKW